MASRSRARYEFSRSQPARAKSCIQSGRGARSNPRRCRDHSHEPIDHQPTLWITIMSAATALCPYAANRSPLVADILEKPVCGNLCPQTLRSRFVINGCGHAFELSAYCTHIQEECRLFVIGA